MAEAAAHLSAPDRPRLPPPASAPLGAGGAEAFTLLPTTSGATRAHSMRRCEFSCVWCGKACRSIAPVRHGLTRPTCIWAVGFIHRFGFRLNTHIHFPICWSMGYGVCEALPDAKTDANSDAKSPDSASAQAVTFHPARIDEAAISQVQVNGRKRILRAFVARGHLKSDAAKDVAGYAHGVGFSVDAHSGANPERPRRRRAVLRSIREVLG